MAVYIGLHPFIRLTSRRISHVPANVTLQKSKEWSYYASLLQELSDHPSNSILDLVLHGEMCTEDSNVLEDHFQIQV